MDGDAAKTASWTPGASTKAESPSPANPTTTLNPKYRAKQSCIPCRARKVKCDRVKPCRSCCVRGLPSECEYVTSTEDRFVMRQADVIASLRNEVKELKKRLKETSNGGVDAARTIVDERATPPSSNSSSSSSWVPAKDETEREAQEKYRRLEAMVDALSTAPPDVAADTLSQIRSGASLNKLPISNGKVDAENGYDDTISLPHAKRYKVAREESVGSSSSLVNPLLTPESDDVKSDSTNSLSSLSHINSYSLPIQLRRQADNFWDPRALQDDDARSRALEVDISRLTGPIVGRKRQLSESPRLLQTISPKYALGDAYLERFVDAFSPRVDSSTGSSMTLRSSAEIRMHSALLADSFRAVSTSFVGRAIRDTALVDYGNRLYVSVLRNLQKSLYDTEGSKSRDILLTVTVMMTYETVQRTGGSSLMGHFQGALKLLEHRGPYRHIHGLEHTFFTELRHYFVTGALIARAPTFLSQDQWKTVPWSAGLTEKDMLQHLLDRVIEIPGFLYEFDKFMDAVNSGTITIEDIAPRQQMLWDWVAELDTSLREWKTLCVDVHPEVHAKEVGKQGDDPFPVFRCRDMETMELYTPPTLVYPNLRLAQTMCLYYSAHIVLAASDTRPMDSAISPSQEYEFACNICRSLEFYIRNAPGSLISRLAFPLRVAFDALPPDGVEKQFAKEVFALVAKRANLSLWGTTMPEISTRKQASVN